MNKRIIYVENIQDVLIQYRGYNREEKHRYIYVKFNLKNWNSRIDCVNTDENNTASDFLFDDIYLIDWNKRIRVIDFINNFNKDE